jgi:uncharacterized protein (TIGR02246 family)
MKKLMWASFTVLLAGAAACGPGATNSVVPPAGAVSAVSASNQIAEQQVIQVVKDWMDAIPKRDADRIGQLLADDFVAILWDGKKRSKAAYLDEIRSGRYAVESITLDDTQARVLGDTAIVTYYQAEKSQSGGVDSSSGSAWTNVLAKRDGRWQVIAEHGSRFN